MEDWGQCVKKRWAKSGYVGLAWWKIRLIKVDALAGQGCWCPLGPYRDFSFCEPQFSYLLNERVMIIVPASPWLLEDCMR